LTGEGVFLWIGDIVVVVVVCLGFLGRIDFEL
jgi:hypothetical protein